MFRDIQFEATWKTNIAAIELQILKAKATSAITTIRPQTPH